MGSSSISDTRSEVFLSPIHRQVLCSVGNNLAGLSTLPIQQLIELLSEVSSLDVFQLIISTPSYFGQAIAQQVLKGAIEVGNGLLVAVILSHKPLQIDINEQICEFGGQTYTAIQRASMLQHKEVVRVMLHHGADVQKTYSCEQHNRPTLNCKFCSKYALDYAIGNHINGYFKRYPDPEIFQLILERSHYISCETLGFLIDGEKDEFVLSIVSKYALTSHERWSAKYGCIWSKMIRSLTLETSLEILNKMHELDLVIDTKLLNAAVIGGHQELVQKLLKNGITPDKSSLHFAIEGGNETLVRIFLKNGITPDKSSLRFAIEGGNETLVRILLKNGITPDKSSLYFAIKRGNEIMVRILLKNGASVHDIPDIKETRIYYGDPIYHDPFSIAIQTQNSQIRELLVENGALERLNQWGPWTAAWFAAVDIGDLKLIEDLIGIRENIPADLLGLALARVSKVGNYQLAVLLLDLGANLDIFRHGYTHSGYNEYALREAINVKSPALVKLLLDSGADPNHAGAIAPAAKWGDHLVVETLLLAGAKPSDEALVQAVMRRDHDLMEMILNAGADISDEALQVATEAGDFDTSAWLLDHGADPNNSNALSYALSFNSPFFDTLVRAHKERYPLGRKGFGSSALSEAIQNRDEPTVKRLLDSGADPNHLSELFDRDNQCVTPFFSAIVVDGGRNTSFVNIILDYGRNSKGFRCSPDRVVAELGYPFEITLSPAITALLAAIGTKSKLMVQLLLREGASINHPAVGRIKRTPLQRAAEIGSIEMVQLCYNSGADVNAPPNRIGGATALQLAAIGGYTAIVIYLLSREADVDAPGAVIDGMTALVGAAANGRIDTVAILLKAKVGRGGSDLSQFEKAISLAGRKGHIPVKNMLKEHLQLITQQNPMNRPDISDRPMANNFTSMHSSYDFEDFIQFDAHDAESSSSSDS